MIKRISYLVVVLLLLVSCNSREDSITNTTEEKKEIQLNFKVSTTQDLSNLQVGERLLVDFEIEDKDTINTTYVIKPEVLSVMYHQRRGIDFNMQVEDKDENNNLKYTNVNELSLKSREQKGGFYLEILEPGTFQHKYILEKYVNGKKVGETSAEFLFNAVKITAFTFYRKISNRHPHRRYYKFIIDDGSQQYDNYLENINGKTHTYIAEHGGIYHKEGDGSIVAHQEKEFRWEDYWRNGQNPGYIRTPYVEKISITQKHADGTINHMEYKNIPIEIR